jgi:hypothetical protein
MDVRRHALKLRYWGERSGQSGSDTLLDLSYESIKAMSGSGVYELRIDDEIGGHRNIRVVFFEPPSDWRPNWESPKPVLRVLEVLPKRRNNWTTFDIDRFWGKREIVKQRWYS